MSTEASPNFLEGAEAVMQSIAKPTPEQIEAVKKEHEQEYRNAYINTPVVPGGKHKKKKIGKEFREGKYRKDVASRMYTVTTIAVSKVYGGNRTVAIYDSFAKAQRCVLMNYGDIWEYSYMLAVIEAVVPNWLYGGGWLREDYWYAWRDDHKAPEGANNREDGGYVAIEKPKMYEIIVGFGIG